MTSLVRKLSFVGGCNIMALLCLILAVMAGVGLYCNLPDVNRVLLGHILGFSSVGFFLSLIGGHPEATLVVCGLSYRAGWYIAAAGGVTCVVGLVVLPLLATPLVLVTGAGVLVLGMAMVLFGVGLGGFLEDQGYGMNDCD